MIRLAVFDDEHVVIEAIKAMIRKMVVPVEVVGWAEDGISAYKVIEEVQPDVVITDIRMPGMNGLELIAKAKEVSPECIFVIISGFLEFEYARSALNLGVIGYIDKPITQDKVRDIFSKVEAHMKRYKKVDAVDNVLDEALSSETDQLYRLIRENRSELIEEQVRKILSLLREIHGDLSHYKQEVHKMICSALGIFFEGHSTHEVDKHFPSYHNLELTHSVEDVDQYVMVICYSMIMKMEVLNTGSHHQTVIKVLEYMNKNYAKDFGLNEMANEFRINPNYLCVLFKEEVGTSFVKYLTRIRLDHAKTLLLSGERVKKVSEDVGYSNYRYFCEIFKRYEGMTPSEYKGSRK